MKNKRIRITVLLILLIWCLTLPTLAVTARYENENGLTGGDTLDIPEADTDEGADPGEALPPEQETGSEAPDGAEDGAEIADDPDAAAPAEDESNGRSSSDWYLEGYATGKAEAETAKSAEISKALNDAEERFNSERESFLQENIIIPNEQVGDNAQVLLLTRDPHTKEWKVSSEITASEDGAAKNANRGYMALKKDRESEAGWTSGDLIQIQAWQLILIIVLAVLIVFALILLAACVLQRR